MRMPEIGLYLTLTCLVTTSANAADLSKSERAAVAATPEQIAQLARVRNDPLDTLLRIDTHGFHNTGRRGADKFARVTIDKKSGVSSFQIYVWARSSGEALGVHRVNYETPDGPVSVDVLHIDTDVLTCVGRGCVYEEHFAFSVPEETLRRIASGAKGGIDDSWKFKVFAKGREETTGILRTEAAGLLLAVDRERARLKISAP